MTRRASTPKKAAAPTAIDAKALGKSAILRLNIYDAQ